MACAHVALPDETDLRIVVDDRLASQDPRDNPEQGKHKKSCHHQPRQDKVHRFKLCKIRLVVLTPANTEKGGSHSSNGSHQARTT